MNEEVLISAALLAHSKAISVLPVLAYEVLCA